MENHTIHVFINAYQKSQFGSAVFYFSFLPVTQINTHFGCYLTVLKLNKNYVSK